VAPPVAPAVIGARIGFEPFLVPGAPTDTVLVPVLLAEMVLLVVGLTLLFGHTVWWSAHSARLEPRLRRAQRELVAHLDRGGSERAAVGAFEVLSARQQARCLLDLAPNVRGASAATLAALAGKLGLVSRAEARCRSRFWWRRLHAVRLLSVIGGNEAPLRALMADRHPAVRAAAAEWAVSHPTPQVLEALLPLLGDATGLCRFTAQDSLLRIGGAAVPSLIGYLERARSREAALGLEVAVGMADPRLMKRAVESSDDPHPDTRRQAARLLGALGGSGAVEGLVSLTVDSDANVRAAAARGLGVLERREAAPRLAGMLRDRSWDVRQAAGLALRALGAPGTIYLRRALSDHDRFARDMAQQILDLPDSVGRVVSS
jgi:HEAT repeat protein